MGEIRIVGPGKTRGYPYPVCKKELSSTTKNRTNYVSKVSKISPDLVDISIFLKDTSFLTLMISRQIIHTLVI